MAAVTGMAIDGRGAIYAASNGLFAFTWERDLKWHIWPGPPGQGRTSAPALGASGQIYVLHGNNLLSLTSDGRIEWAREIPSPHREFSPVVARNGTVYAAGYDFTHRKEPFSVLYAFGPDGSLKWTFATEYFLAPPALDEEGTIYFTGPRGLHAVDADGKLKWLFDGQGWWSRSTPAVSSDHVVYFGLDRWLFAVGPDGKFKWRFETNRDVASSPAIDAEGNIWFGSCDRRLYCVDRHGTLVGNWPTQGLACATPIIDRSGIIYLRDGRSLRVLRGPNGVATNALWPMMRHNAQGTARVGAPHL
jgi:outer membrane protein assembly factor BamB